MPTLNINTDAVVKFTNTLEKLHKSALPSAIRNSLNDAAFDLKTKTMPAESRDTFKNRVPNFFKANSKFDKATGFNINQMKSTIGFVEGGLKGGNNYAVSDLEQQESGGSIDKKSFIPMEPSRSGNSANRPVRPNARLKTIKNIINSKNQSGNKKQQFVKATMKAGVGGFVLGNTGNGSNTLWKVNSLPGNHQKFNPKLTPLYNWSKGRNVKVRPTHFMKDASKKTATKIESFYIKQAERQIKKYY